MYILQVLLSIVHSTTSHVNLLKGTRVSTEVSNDI